MPHLPQYVTVQVRSSCPDSRLERTFRIASSIIERTPRAKSDHAKLLTACVRSAWHRTSLQPGISMILLQFSSSPATVRSLSAAVVPNPEQHLQSLAVQKPTCHVQTMPALGCRRSPDAHRRGSASSPPPRPQVDHRHLVVVGTGSHRSSVPTASFHSRRTRAVVALRSPSWNMSTNARCRHRKSRPISRRTACKAPCGLLDSMFHAHRVGYVRRLVMASSLSGQLDDLAGQRDLVALEAVGYPCRPPVVMALDPARCPALLDAARMLADGGMRQNAGPLLGVSMPFLRAPPRRPEICDVVQQAAR
jgi:hypothetical protein